VTSGPPKATLATPRQLDRPVDLFFQGDWGQASMHRICGWLSQELGDRCPPGSRFSIRSGRGGADAVKAVLRGEVDVAVMTPTAAVAMFGASVGPLEVGGAGRLRALGTLPQRDRLVTAVDAALGVSSMLELAFRLPELRIATAPDDGVNLVGLAAHRQLGAVGVEFDAVRDAGGEVLYWERPFPAIAAFRDGVANVLIQEAFMHSAWGRITERHPVIYLDVAPPVTAMFSKWLWPSAVVPRGFLPGLDRDLTALDFSDFLVLCSESLPDDIASLIAWCMVATRGALEAQYRHLPPEHSPITYPLEPRAIASAPIPLHSAAEATYAAMGDDEQAGGGLIWA
jgi:hypothetical protein